MSDKLLDFGSIFSGAGDIVSGGLGALGDLFGNVTSGSSGGGSFLQSALGPAILGGASVLNANAVADQNEYARAQSDRQFDESLRQRELDREFQERSLMQQLAIANANQELQAAMQKQRLLSQAFQTAQGSTLRGREDESASLNAMVQNIQRALGRD